MATIDTKVEQLDYTPKGFWPSDRSKPVLREGFIEKVFGIRTYIVNINQKLVYDLLSYNASDNKSNVLPVMDKALTDFVLAHLEAGQSEFRIPL